MKIGRNDPCHCGSGNKYKKCCIDKDRAARAAEAAAEAAAKAKAEAEVEADVKAPPAGAEVEPRRPHAPPAQRAPAPPARRSLPRRTM